MSKKFRNFARRYNQKNKSIHKNMKKHIYWIVAITVVFALSLAGCGKKDDKSEVEKLLDLPYSKLTPDQQKAKLEQESINFLREMNALSNSPAIKAIEHLGELLDRSEPNVPSPISQVNDWKEIFDLTDVTGVFTWNRSQNRWVETSSATELRFVFPATTSGTTNNATLIVKAENSGRIFTGTGERYWEEYNSSTGQWDWGYDDYEIEVYLPKSATATLTIGANQAASIEFGAEYNTKDVPEKAIYKMSTNDGYEILWTVNTRGDEKISMKLSRNNNSLVEAVGKTNAKISEIEDLLLDGEFSDEDIYKRLGKADAIVKLMNDLALVYWIDTEKFVREMDAIWEWEDKKWDEIHSLPWDSYVTQRNALEKELREKIAKANNDFMKLALVSTKDNFKVADLVAKAEKEDYSWSGLEYYEIVYYLKFNDNTLVEASVYFGDGFDKLISEWEDFINAFNR